MSISVWLWAHLQTGLLLVAGLCLLPAHVRSSRGLKALAAILGLGAPLLPLHAVDLAGLVYAHAGALCVPGLALLATFSAGRLGNPGLVPADQRSAWKWGLMVLALALYPMALGLGDFDPYGLGFSGPTLPLALCMAALWAWFGGYRHTAILLLAVLWSWLLGLGESVNLWDYLLDVWSVLAVSAIQAQKLWRWRR